MRGIQRERDDPHLTGKTWNAWLSEGCDYDSWGQPIEAMAAYCRLKNDIDDCVSATNSSGSQRSWTIDERQERSVDVTLSSHPMLISECRIEPEWKLSQSIYSSTESYQKSRCAFIFAVKCFVSRIPRRRNWLSVPFLCRRCAVSFLGRFMSSRTTTKRKTGSTNLSKNFP